MAPSGTLGLVAGAAFCGMLAAWLAGAWVYVRFARRARAGGRRVIRVVVSLPAYRVGDRLSSVLAASRGLRVRFTGQLENAITADLTGPLPRRGLRAFLATDVTAHAICRLDEEGSEETRVQLRLDFSPLIERVRALIRVWLLVVWPLWMIAVTGAVSAAFLTSTGTNPWWALHLFHALYPGAGLVLLFFEYRRTRRAVGDIVVASLRESFT